MSLAEFNRALLDAIEGGLSLLGDSPKKAIFYHLENSFHLKKKDIPLNLSEFQQALERVFGPGAPYLEKVIIGRLYERLGLRFQEPKLIDLVAFVDNAKRQISLE